MTRIWKKTRIGWIVRCAVLSMTLFGTTSGGASAQSLFEPVVLVNGGAVTAWELEQRTTFLTVFGTPGDVRQIALERLIEERIQLDAAEAQGIVVTDAAVQAGMEEFASRTNLPFDQFLIALGQEGVDEAAFRAFVRAGLSWREVVQSRFGSTSRPSARDIRERSLEIGSEGGERVLLTEIVLPGGDPLTYQASVARAEEIANITDPAEFRRAARLFSSAQSRIDGGEIDWRALGSLPEELRGPIASLNPGQTSRPILLEQAIFVFHLRDKETIPPATPQDTVLDIARFRVETAANGAEISQRADRCDDLYRLAPSVERLDVRRDALTPDLASALSALDVGEIGPVGGDATNLVMFCGERLDVSDLVTVEAIGNELLGRNLGEAATRYLAELRANAVITRLE